MKKTLILVLIIIFTMGIFGAVFAADPFTDVPAKHWAYDAVSKLSQAGFIDGYGDRTYRGDKVISRYEMAIIVARIMTKTDKADAEQKAMIEKLAKEFASELEGLNVRVKAVEKKTNSWIGGETRITYRADNPGQPGYHRLKAADQFDWRQRINFNGTIGAGVNWKARLATSPTKFGNSEYANGSDMYLDIANLTFQNGLLGMDTVRVGRSPLDAFGNGLFGKPMGADNIKVTKKIGNSVDFTGFVGNIKYPGSPVALSKAMSDPNTVTSGQLAFKLDKAWTLKTAAWWSDIVTDQSTMNITSGSFTQSKGLDVSVVGKVGNLNVLGEYIASDLSNPTGVVPHNPKGWVVQVGNGLPWGAFYPILNMVDYRKPGTDAWMVSYRSVDAGTLPTNAGGFDTTCTSYTGNTTGSGWGNYNPYTKGTDNVNVLYLAYQKVLAKNMIMSMDYQNFKIKDMSLTSGLNGSKLDQTYALKFEYFY